MLEASRLSGGASERERGLSCLGWEGGVALVGWSWDSSERLTFLLLFLPAFATRARGKVLAAAGGHPTSFPRRLAMDLLLLHPLGHLERAGGA